MLNSINRKHSKRISALTRRVAAIVAAAIAVSPVAASSTVSAKLANPISAPIAENQLSFPLPEFAEGSYFNENETACTHHRSCDYYGGCPCLSYDGAIQCMGFAKYAADRYAHRSSWQRNSGDISEAIRPLSDVGAVKTLIQKLGVGAYVRVDNAHSFVIINITENDFTIYEANYSPQDSCRVSTRQLTYKGFSDLYSNITTTMSHNFSTYATHNSIYHKIKCSTSGCNGYLLENHTYIYKNGQYVCTICKYSTTNLPSIMSTEDKPDNYGYGDEYGDVYTEKDYEPDIDNATAYGDNVSEDTEDVFFDEENALSIQDDLT